MSKLYGTLSGDGRAAAQTRCAHRTTKAVAQSHQGSIAARIWIDSDGVHRFEIASGAGSTVAPSHTIMEGVISDGKLTLNYVDNDLPEQIAAIAAQAPESGALESASGTSRNLAQNQETES